MSEQTQWLLLVAGAYLLGSIPVGLLLGFTRGVDIRTHGSGNIGATNTMRALGKKLGVLCFLLDVAKGAVPTLIAAWLLGALSDETLPTTLAWQWLAVAAASIAGHMYPVWLRFHGGKGVATGFGAMASVWPYLTIPVAVAILVWIILARATRLVGVSSCAAVASLPISISVAALLKENTTLSAAIPFLITTSAIASVVIWRHRGNLARTIAGKEPHIGDPVDDAR